MEAGEEKKRSAEEKLDDSKDQHHECQGGYTSYSNYYYEFKTTMIQ